jgi:hypothetical protein
MSAAKGRNSVITYLTRTIALAAASSRIFNQFAYSARKGAERMKVCTSCIKAGKVAKAA